GAGDREGDLVDGLGDDRIHLAGHDAGPGLHGGKVDLAEARLRAGGQQTQVVADLRELDRVALERGGERRDAARIAGRLDEVARRAEVETADLAQVAQHGRRVAGVRGDAGADRRGAHVDLGKQRGVLGEA